MLVLSEKEGFTIRLAVSEDAKKYYQENFNPLDLQVAKITGSKDSYSENEVINFFLKCVDDYSRFDFLIIAPDDSIIGETVINEIDEENNSANFKIAIFQSAYHNQGIGSWATKLTRDFAFSELLLQELYLEVLLINTKAINIYKRCGFVIYNETEDIVYMKINREQWLKINENNHL